MGEIRNLHGGVWYFVHKITASNIAQHITSEEYTFERDGSSMILFAERRPMTGLLMALSHYGDSRKTRYLLSLRPGKAALGSTDEFLRVATFPPTVGRWYTLLERLRPVYARQLAQLQGLKQQAQPHQDLDYIQKRINGIMSLSPGAVERAHHAQVSFQIRVLWADAPAGTEL